MTEWNAGLYLKFEDERTRPARDLLAQVPLATIQRGVDLGCGPGNSTELIAARYPQAQIIGVDTAPDMLAAARKRLPAATFLEADVTLYQSSAPVDLIFANAVLQWVPDNIDLLPKLLAQLSPGGVLAVQMPDNLDEPSHSAMREAAAVGPYAARLAPVAAGRDVLPSVADYYDRLTPYSARVDIWHTIYEHPLAGPAAIVEWVRATGLRPFLAQLSQPEQADFLSRYEALLAERYPRRADGKVLLAFPRLFIVAVR